MAQYRSWFRTALLSCSTLLVMLEPGVAQAQEAPLTLERALALAREHSESYPVERELLAQASLARARAWAAVLPTLSASGTYTRSDRQIAFGDRVLQRQDSVSGNASATVTILNGGTIADIVSARHSTNAAEHETLWRENELDFEVARAWYTALAGRNLLAVAERTLATAEEHHAAMEARRSAGVVLAIEEGRARLEVVEAREGVTRARNALEGSLDYLAFVIGLEPPIAVAEPNAEEPSAPPPDSPGEAGADRQRIDLQAAALVLRAARTDVTSAWMDYLPSISLSGSYRATQNTGFSGDPDSWQLMLTVDWLIFDGGLRRANRLERASRVREARLRLQQLDRSARHEVRQARRELDTSAATVQTSTERVELARVTRDQVMRRYRGGVDNSLEVVEADDALEQAELSLVSGQLELAIARLALLQALGFDPVGRELER